MRLGRFSKEERTNYLSHICMLHIAMPAGSGLGQQTKAPVF